MAHSNNRRLNPSEEIIKQYFRELKRYPPLSRKEELALLERIRNGDVRARRRLVMANLRFVVAVAKKYKFINDVPFEDLIAVGNLGLMRAMKRFDIDHNVRFISYAVWWIRQAIIQTISLYSNAVRLPVSRVHQGLKIKKTEESLGKKLNRKPTLNELAQECGMNPDDLRKFFTDTPVVVSMDGARVEGDDEDMMLSDAISDHNETNPETISERKSLGEEIQKVLTGLTDREKIVLKHRFGLQQAKMHTLEEIGKLLGVTRERVRQIEAQALEKLRGASRSTRLNAYRFT